jgi:hypothetical protein
MCSERNRNMPVRKVKAARGDAPNNAKTLPSSNPRVRFEKDRVTLMTLIFRAYRRDIYVKIQYNLTKT